MTKQPWTTFPQRDGFREDNSWNAAEWPYVVTWSVSYPDRLTHWISFTRKFQTIEEAIAAYKMPFKGLDVSASMYNGGKPGSHMTRLAFRKCGKPTKWEAGVPQELR